jgi:hypothetical protein
MLGFNINNYENSIQEVRTISLEAYQKMELVV